MPQSNHAHRETLRTFFVWCLGTNTVHFGLLILWSLSSVLRSFVSPFERGEEMWKRAKSGKLEKVIDFNRQAEVHCHAIQYVPVNFFCGWKWRRDLRSQRWGDGQFASKLQTSGAEFGFWGTYKLWGRMSGGGLAFVFTISMSSKPSTSLEGANRYATAKKAKAKRRGHPAILNGHKHW